jgi:hypothetical protein
LTNDMGIRSDRPRRYGQLDAHGEGAGGTGHIPKFSAARSPLPPAACSPTSNGYGCRNDWWRSPESKSGSRGPRPNVGALRSPFTVPCSAMIRPLCKSWPPRRRSRDWIKNGHNAAAPAA